MKRTIYYMIIGYLLLGTGCSDWLSVNPKDKVEQKEMFSDENGFKNALIGNYIMLKDSKLYGKTLTMEFCENLALLCRNSCISLNKSCSNTTHCLD